MIKPELLAPAGNLEKVKWAFLYGADAVYFGGQNFGLRANAKNLSVPEIKEACDLAHSLNRKVYVTVNIVFHDEDLDGLEEYLKDLADAKVDAIIFSDPLVLELAKKVAPTLNFVLSTQQSTMNYEACKFWKNEGVGRVVLARETSKEDYKKIKEECDIELETFIQGAMCVGYSGRCLLSNYFTNRDSNRGGCSQICRWNFKLCDKDKNEIPTNGNIDFTMSVKDLCMISHIPELIDMGIDSFKIEGRMRSIYYIATVLHIYRKIIDEYCDEGKVENIEKYEKVLARCANRDSVVQYFNKKPGIEGQFYVSECETSNQDFLGVVVDYNEDTKEAIIEQRNCFSKGDTVTIFDPSGNDIDLKIEYIKNEDGEEVEKANRPTEHFTVNSPTKLEVNSLVRVQF